MHEILYRVICVIIFSVKLFPGFFISYETLKNTYLQVKATVKMRGGLLLKLLKIMEIIFSNKPNTNYGENFFLCVCLKVKKEKNKHILNSYIEN